MAVEEVIKCDFTGKPAKKSHHVWFKYKGKWIQAYVAFDMKTDRNSSFPFDDCHVAPDVAKRMLKRMGKEGILTQPEEFD